MSDGRAPTSEGTLDGGAGSEGAGPPVASGPAPFPSPLVRFAELFREGRYWDSHEVLEDSWRQTDSRFYHGLILLASAWVHVGRENAHGIDAQLRKALTALEGLPRAYLGMDLDGLRRAARRGRRRVAERRDDPPSRWIDVVPPPPMELDPARVAGDEEELRSATSGSPVGREELRR